KRAHRNNPMIYLPYMLVVEYWKKHVSLFIFLSAKTSLLAVIILASVKNRKSFLKSYNVNVYMLQKILFRFFAFILLSTFMIPYIVHLKTCAASTAFLHPSYNFFFVSSFNFGSKRRSKCQRSVISLRLFQNPSANPAK